MNEIEPERIVEAAFWQAHVDRHLAALKAFDRHARACLLPLHAAPSGLALAATDTPAHTNAVLRCAWVISQVVQLHNLSPRGRRRTPLLTLFPIHRYAVLFNDADQVRDFVDHAANCRVVGDNPAAVHFIQTEADKRLALIVGPADGAANLLDGQ